MDAGGGQVARPRADRRQARKLGPVGAMSAAAPRSCSSSPPCRPRVCCELRRPMELRSTPEGCEPLSVPSARLDAGPGSGLFEFEGQFQQPRFASKIGSEHHADWHTARGFGQRQ